MADNLQYVNESTTTLYSAYAQAPAKESTRLQFWRSMRDTILSKEGTHYVSQLSAFNAGGVRAMQASMSTQREQECNEMRSKGGVPQDVVACYCDASQEYLVCSAKLQLFMDSDAIDKPAPPETASAGNQTTLMAAVPKCGMNVRHTKAAFME